MSDHNAHDYFKGKSVQEYLAEMNQYHFEGELIVPLVAIDDGYAQYNSALMVIEMADGEAKLKIVEDRMPALASRGRHTAGMAGGALNLYGRVDTGEEYTVSQYLANPEDTRTDDYATTTLNLMLVHAALDRLGLAGEEVAIATGLPLKQYMAGDDERNTRLIDKKCANLMSPCYIGTGSKPSAIVHSVKVYPEAVCGMIDYLVDEYGDNREGVDPNVVRLGLDIGGNTTDMAIILPGNQVGARQTIKYGVSHVKDRLRQLMNARFDLHPDEAMLEEALRTGFVQWFGGEKENVEAEVRDAISTVMDPILEAVKAFMRDFPSLREIIGFGGGMALMQNSIRERYKNIIILDNPDGANARGALKYSLLSDLEEIMEQVNNSRALRAQKSA
ncbi:ParM/StbA family protein [Marinobacterium stanieri]|uniref:Plasmid segregation actin-type ATPase ParM n=1 Tax=Marinobacterium stanieri TaxID=49186 RepID=A0A1N6X8L7_9GAMM|nr:ParM/StbA family protein [Marinobacterium stanieri]SIQ98610.1 plasmid segregation actin-type ATPase ParM [Marinobacterium stanieri]